MGLVWAPFNLLVGSTQVHMMVSLAQFIINSITLGSSEVDSLVGTTVVGRHDLITAGAAHHQEPLNTLKPGGIPTAPY